MSDDELERLRAHNVQLAHQLIAELRRQWLAEGRDREIAQRLDRALDALNALAR